MNPPENVKRFGLLIVTFTIITYICTYVTFIYNILAYFGYLLVSLILAWQATKFYRTKCRPKELVSPNDKAVFITGCDSGFGNTLAANLDKLGFTVFAGCLFPDKEGAQALKKKCSKRLAIVKVDVTNQDSVEEAVKFVENNLAGKKFWALVNNAGIIDYCGIESGQKGISSFSRQMDVNVYGLVRTTKCFLPMLRLTPQSRVILLGSVAGRFVGPSMCGYSMSKFAVRAFGEGLRRELKQLNVYVSVIEPTFYKTAISDETITLKTLDKNWDDSPDDIKRDYAHLHDPHREIIKLFVRTRHSRIEDVTDTIAEAIHVAEPEFYYRICYFFDKITSLMEYCPEEMNDIIVNETVGPSVLRFIGFVNERFQL